MKLIQFKNAKPIWAVGKENEWNVHLKLTAKLKKDGADILKVATHGYYQLFINGRYIAFGPARAGRGYFRVDEIDIKDKLTNPENTIEILVVSYGVNNYSNINQSPFVICEIGKSDSVVKFTGGEDFDLYLMNDYRQCVSRYSFQRGFCESYIKNKETEPKKIDFYICEDKKFIERGVKYPDYERMELDGFIYEGNCRKVKREEYKKLHAESVGSQNCMQFMPPEENITNELQELEYDNIKPVNKKNLTIKDGGFAIGAFKREGTGMISFKCRVKEKTVLYITYDEMLTDNRVNPQRLNINAAVKYVLDAGEYDLVSFEPCSMKYICFSSLGSEIELEEAALIEYKHPAFGEKLEIKNPKLKMIYDASVESFRQNAVDIFTDCPSRERAGWLCDSFFIGRAEYFLASESIIEKNFLENFLMEEKYKYLPENVFPMCYPSDHMDGNYIPNWCMWLVIELYEYFKRSSDSETVKLYRDRLYDLAGFFERYENRDGLLENLDKWVFVDWSDSNSNVQDVSFPSNMMYAYMLERMSVLYNDTSLKEKAEKIRNKICELSFDGEFFCDNLIKTENGYKKSGVCTESCQYYAFFTDTATPQTHKKLWDRLINEFGPDRIKKGLYKNIGKSNAFVGNFIRLELLAREGLYSKLLDEISGYFGYMAERTGTLWELIDDNASMNHGFSGQVAVWIYQCLTECK